MGSARGRSGYRLAALRKRRSLHLGRGLREEAEQVVRGFEQIDEESTQAPHRIEVDSETLEFAYA